MKKLRSSLTFTICFYLFFLVMTIITVFVVYKEIDHTVSFMFLIGYVLFLVIILLYAILATVMKMIRIKRDERTKRIWRFITFFALISGGGLIFSFFTSSELDYYKTFSIALGMSFGLTFFDLAFPNGTKMEG
ncbi:hypothetical protein [Sutcliffiella rhizosphaerae]|uniref:Uncharacterized protein n=1 Tax=Sutcliffiella rhizosphaerae TaxID=2880967 RepID=A0ABM8YR37_9BACI|nr:hypothetical protein [Sutcliffiella rhizosphaerae]CAG9622404.1 hypothetical protein BACCIP111883_03195 [Sutcliffiella rhizosphaerae]